MSKPINMATGGLMSMPPYIEKYEEKDEGITPYDVKTPESARKGLPARLLGKTRTRFSKGDDVKPLNEDDIPILEEHDLEPSDTKYAKLNVAEKLLYKNLKAMDASDVLDKKGKDKLKKLEKKKNQKALGGLMNRTSFSSGDAAFRNKIRPIDIPDELEEGPAEGDIPGEKYAGGKAAKDKLIIETINRLEAQKEITEDSATLAKINNQIKSLESKVSTRITAALGGYMDENDIAEQTPLALNIGGAVGRVEERKDYQAYAEGDIVDDEAVVEDENLLMEDGSLLTPVGIEDDMMLAETNAEMTAEDEALDDIDADAVLDTSMLSEEEEIVLDEAIEMHPELEAIIPKIVATEFTEDELVEGPGDGTSDSIPAMLSDGEFVFTAKAVKSLGVDKLRKMMAQAEEAYDAGQIDQEDNASQFEADSLLV
jgi:hypothetical protein